VIVLIVVGTVMVCVGVAMVRSWHRNPWLADYENVWVYRFWASGYLLVGLGLLVRAATLP
jgi:hypothetical protein